MERAGKLLAKLKWPAGAVTPQDLAVAAWAEAVGPRIAARARAVALISGRLVVEVEDSVWQRQLSALKGQILQRYEQVAGAGLASEIEFRLPARRQPRMATEPRRQAPADEAGGIRDPRLPAVYRQKRGGKSA